MSVSQMGQNSLLHDPAIIGREPGRERITETREPVSSEYQPVGSMKLSP